MTSFRALLRQSRPIAQRKTLHGPVKWWVEVIEDGTPPGVRHDRGWPALTREDWLRGAVKMNKAAVWRSFNKWQLADVNERERLTPRNAFWRALRTVAAYPPTPHVTDPPVIFLDLTHQRKKLERHLFGGRGGPVPEHRLFNEASLEKLLEGLSS